MGPESIPIEILANRKLSIMESIVGFLKEKENMSFHEIGILLNRDERNIWTIYNRSRKKISQFTTKKDAYCTEKKDGPISEISKSNIQKNKTNQNSFSIYGTGK